MQLFESVSRWFSDIPVVRRARNGQRVVMDAPVVCRVIGQDESNVALLRDLSIGGACIRCDLPLARGDAVWLRANGGPEGELEFTAVVVDVRPNDLGFFSDFGLKIVELNLDSARVLANVIATRLAAARTAHRDTLPL
jgi:hypothetical protein